MRGYSHLSDDEREQIGLLKVLGHSIGAIARAIRRPKSTISRELSRNRLPSGRYSPLHAAGAYQLRRRREALIEKDRALRSFVLDRLAEGWTPEQIAGWLKAGNERRLRAVGCETIYAFIYRAAQKAEQLWRYLTRRHKRRRPRRSRPSRDTIKDRVRQGEVVAQEERRRLRLGIAPIVNAAETISEQGVWTAATDLPNGNADKAAVIAAIRARGFHPADDNEADALAILLWAIETQGGVR